MKVFAEQFFFAPCGRAQHDNVRAGTPNPEHELGARNLLPKPFLKFCDPLAAYNNLIFFIGG